jgi:hypothetical protein
MAGSVCKFGMSAFITSLIYEMLKKYMQYFRRFSRSREKRLFASSFLSFRLYKCGSHRMDFREICYWGLYREFVAKKQIWLQTGKNIGHYA